MDAVVANRFPIKQRNGIGGIIAQALVRSCDRLSQSNLRNRKRIMYNGQQVVLEKEFCSWLDIVNGQILNARKVLKT
ncbi:MAG: hypothetical protein AAF125_16975, partial [Chloroflexota bacterium]